MMYVIFGYHYSEKIYDYLMKILSNVQVTKRIQLIRLVLISSEQVCVCVCVCVIEGGN